MNSNKPIIAYAAGAALAFVTLTYLDGKKALNNYRSGDRDFRTWNYGGYYESTRLNSEEEAIEYGVTYHWASRFCKSAFFPIIGYNAIQKKAVAVLNRSEESKE